MNKTFIVTLSIISGTLNEGKFRCCKVTPTNKKKRSRQFH